MTPFISNIILTYNRKELLVEHLNMLEKQTYKDFEVIVADDGSTDGTAQIATSFKGGCATRTNLIAVDLRRAVTGE